MFGRFDENLPHLQWWGARAIYHLRYEQGKCIPDVDILSDRQSWDCGVAGSQETEAFRTWLNETALPKLRKDCILHGDGYDVWKYTSDDGRYFIEACPQGSCGYLYIGAYQVKP